MQQQATRSPAFADRSIPIVSRTPSAKEQFAGVLNHDDLSTGNPLRRPGSCVVCHFCDTYLFIAQKTREPDLPSPAPCKASDARTRSSNQRLV